MGSGGEGSGGVEVGVGWVRILKSSFTSSVKVHFLISHSSHRVKTNQREKKQTNDTYRNEGYVQI